MVKKFNRKEFEIEFKIVLEETYKDRIKYGCVIIGLSSICKDVCRRKKYAMWNNRENIIKIVQEWWDNLPEGKQFYKKLFDKNVRVSHSMGPTFIYLKDSSTIVKCSDLLNFAETFY